MNCASVPASGLELYVSGDDWLEDLVNADDNDVDGVQCQGSLGARSTSIDWLRYGFDMLSGQNVPIDDYVDLYDAANVHNWDADDNAVGSDGSTATSDDVIVRWEAAADGHPNNYQSEHDSAKVNGQDH